MTRRPSLAVLVLLAGLAPVGAARAQADNERLFEPPPTLPESNNGTIQRGEGQAPERIDKLRDVFLALQSCWRRNGERLSGDEVTIRLSFRRDGAVLGEPKITYYRAGKAAPERQQAFIASVRDAFARCTPLRLTPSFGAAIAGRPFTFRFVDYRR